MDAGLVLIGGVDRSGPWELSVVICPALTYEHSWLTNGDVDRRKSLSKATKIELAYSITNNEVQENAGSENKRNAYANLTRHLVYM